MQGLLEATGRLEIVGGDRSATLGDGWSFTRSHGHTPGLLLTRVEMPARTGDVRGRSVPGVPWVHLPITMGYDRYPELLIDEKRVVLERIRNDDGWMFFTHDASVAAAKVGIDAKQRFFAAEPQADVHWT